MTTTLHLGRVPGRVRVARGVACVAGLSTSRPYATGASFAHPSHPSFDGRWRGEHSTPGAMGNGADLAGNATPMTVKRPTRHLRTRST